MSNSHENQHHSPDSFNVPVNPDNGAYSLRFVKPLREDLAIERTQLDAGDAISYEGVSGADARVVGISDGMIDEDTNTRQELLAVVATDNGKDFFAVVSIASTPELYSIGLGGETHLKNPNSPHRDRIAKLSDGGISALPNRATVLVHLNRDSPNDVIPVRTQDLPGEVVVRDDFTVGVDAAGAVTITGSETTGGVEVFTRKLETTESESPTITAEQLAYKGLKRLYTRKPTPEMITRTHVAGRPDIELNDPRHWAIDPEQAGYLLNALALSKD